MITLSPVITLSLPTMPVEEDQLLLKINGQQAGIVTEKNGKWLLWGLASTPAAVEFPTIYALLEGARKIHTAPSRYEAQSDP